MCQHESGSVSRLIGNVREGQEAAIQEIVERYIERIKLLARKHVGRNPQVGTDEDVAMQAMKSAIMGLSDNRFPDVKDREGFWSLLSRITTNKAINEYKRWSAKKRSTPLDQRDTMDLFEGPTFPPDMLLQAEDAITQIVESLEDAKLREIVWMKVEGYSNDEVAEKLGVSRRTIERKLNLILREWQFRFETD